MKNQKRQISHWRKIPKRYFLYLALLLLPLFLPLWGGPRPRRFRLHGNGTEMGRQFGSKSAVSVRLLCNIYVKKFICRGDEKTYAERTGKALSLWPAIPAVYQNELQALAEAASVDKGAIVLGNSFIDLGYSASGCRAVVAQTGEHLFHAHNLDWDSVGGLANWSISIIRRNPTGGRRPTVSIALPGMVGSLDIINDCGITLSLNQVGYGSGTQTEPVFIKLRRIAETCCTYDQARQEILNSSPDMPFILTVSSATEGKAGVFEPIGGAICERNPTGGRVVADNSTWGMDSGRSSVHRAAQRTDLTSVAGMQQLLRDPDVLLSCNIYSVIFDFQGNRLYLASGRVPAATREYRTYRLFAEPENGPNLLTSSRVAAVSVP